MNCSEYAAMLTGYIDEELTPEDRARLEKHLTGCEACRGELAALTGLKEELAMMDFVEPTDVELDAYWAGVYNRLERRLGWILLSVGAVALIAYGAFELVEKFVRDPSVALILKVGVLAGILGLVILFVSILRERLAVSKADRYSQEIKR